MRKDPKIDLRSKRKINKKVKDVEKREGEKTK